MFQIAAAYLSVGEGFCTICRCTVPVYITNGSPTTSVFSCPVARLGDTVQDPAGHVGYITTTSARNIADNMGVAMVGSEFTGVVSGFIQTGAPVKEIGV
jgi:uncharacterized Zn-binding protein involved in type VI secretion